MMIKYFIFIMTAISVLSCGKSKINEGEQQSESGNKVLVSLDQKSCVTPWGETILSGESRKAFKQNKTANCTTTCESIAADVVCQDGVLSGADQYLYNSCEKPKCDCKVDFLAQPVTLKHGDFLKTYSKSLVECGVCTDYEVQRQCVDGLLTGEAAATNQSCTSKH